MSDEQNKNEEVVALFLQHKDVNTVSKESGVSVDKVNEIIRTNKREIQEIIQEGLGEMCLIKDEKGSLDVEAMLTQLNSTTLGKLKQCEGTLEPKEVTLFLAEARKQLKLQAQVQGKFSIVRDDSGLSQNNDFKTFLIQNLTLMANGKVEPQIHSNVSIEPLDKK